VIPQTPIQQQQSEEDDVQVMDVDDDGEIIFYIIQ